MSGLLGEVVKKYPNRPALYYEEKCWNFREVRQEVDAWVNFLQQKIGAKQTRVALFSRNSEKLYFIILALWELDKELVFLNRHLSKEEILYQIETADVHFLLAEMDECSKLKEFPVEIIPIALPNSTEQNHSELHKKGDFSPNHTASIMFTSGTTGRPKGVVQRFCHHLSNAKATIMSMKVTPFDCWACCVPLFHVSGLSILMRQLLSGCSIRLYAKFAPETISQDLQQGNVTLISLVNVMLQELLRIYPSVGYASNFRTVLLGGSPASLELLTECQEKNIAVIQSYGMSETCSQIVALSFQDAKEKIGSSGKPLPGVQLQIRVGNREAKAFEVGEIVVKSSSIIEEYLLNNQNNACKSHMEDGWFQTGDIGYLDTEGFLYVKARLSELIISGGENIYPAEVENCVMSYPDIEEAAVIGEKDSKWGAVPVVYYRAKKQIETEKLVHFISDKLASFKVPKKYYQIEKMPRTASGKIAKRLLKKER
ncbi:o-succinylbenzoate--CoA ligase [Vagococcus entomophilus]|uniref:2-succinylbenzoate--CoA ligase n=1 Tax=Vagococcus entomophilus TaxID=1160095 RepID=A0A430AFH0_9ENTE|nr:o-succinylbenzoate--CoA ligase [Vagococcus entomophilus]RSU06476.1 o-succinylbenzoate--CoA ligase [Vagococcus entomophilus]